MSKRLLLLIFSLLLTVPIIAQNADTPEAAVNAALTAVEEQVGTRATNFTFQLLGATTDSSLGCGLVQGEDLGFEWSAVQVDVIYPDSTTYSVYTNISGQTVILCDAQFSQEVLNAQLDPATACSANPVTPLPAYIAPNITVDGVFTANVGEAYRIYGVSSDGGWYQVASDFGLGWIEATSVTLSGNCNNLAITGVTNPLETVVCFIAPLGEFTNVRSAPTVESQRVGRIYENQVFQASARNSDSTWFYIEPAGWVSNTVVSTQGDCASITANDGAVGGGFAEVDTVSTIDSDTATILNQFECPVGFAGYLQPRIAIGNGTAQVGGGDIPNTLRAFPSVDDTQAPRLGVIQPLRVIDRVIAGPACNQGFVWWLVEIDGVVGWTAESNQSSNEYFLEPTGDTPQVATSTVETIDVGTNAIEELFITSDGSTLYALTTEAGFGDGTVGVVNIYDVNTGNALARIEEPSGIRDIDYASDANRIVVASGNGNVTIYDANSFAQIGQIPDASSDVGLVNVEITPSGDFIVVSRCDTDDCTSGILRLYNGIDFNEINIVSLPESGAIDLDISADGSTLAVVKTQEITFHDVADLNRIAIYDNFEGFGIDSIVLSADGASGYFAGCNNADCTEGRISLVTTATGALSGVVPSHSTQASEIILNPAQTRFVTVGNASSDIIERSATTGEITQQFNPQLITVASLDYTPDGTQLIIGTTDGRVIFQDLEQ